MSKEIKQQRTHNGIPIDSEEEYMFLLWAEELMEYGFITKIDRAESYNLSDKLVNTYTEEVVLKTKNKLVEKNQILLNGHIYTPEFILHWTREGFLRFNDFFDYPSTKFEKPFIGSNLISIVEIKPAFDQNNMTRLFKVNQKWMYEKYRIYVNQIEPHNLFEKTFTPIAWLTTKTGKRRVIHHKIKTITEYLNPVTNGIKE